MNLQLANVISDLSGVTGQQIVRAILRGERDPRELAKLSDPRIDASKEGIAKAWKATGAKSCSLLGALI
jgi:transposase